MQTTVTSGRCSGKEPPMKRKPIQIAVTSATEEGFEALYALCDDGSIWRKERLPMGNVLADWEPIPPIPAPLKERGSAPG